MPRQDVPYGGAICRLKERIAEIWDELGKKLHSINGVEGDGAGDVKIVSGDAAIVITSDQVNHQIEVALDSSRLPAASVSSVNGQTGAVVLDATDIRTTNNTPIQTKITALESATQTALNKINAEAQNRQAADNVLQGNINSVQASIPGAAATAVANDPTVAQLATDVPNKVDKITSGSSLKAYTHTGATQGETSIIDGTAANSIGLRDTNGRMQAADPASGATDKTLVTANWVSQTGSGAPNNLIHRSGDEDLTGTKNNPTMGIGNVYIGGSTQRWIRIAYTTIVDASICGYVLPDKLVGIDMSCEFYLIGRTNNSIFNIRATIWANPNPALFALTYDGTTYELWYHYNENTTNKRCTFCIRGANGGRPYTLDGVTTKASLDPADYTYIRTPTVI